MDAYDIDSGVPTAVAKIQLPGRLGFGDINTPVMFDAEWRDGAWQRGRLLPYGPIALWPGSRALQYGELVFEGLKAYRVGRSRPSIGVAPMPTAAASRARRRASRCRRHLACSTAQPTGISALWPPEVSDNGRQLMR